MAKSRITTCKPNSHERMAVIADSCVVWSSGTSRWDGLIVERHLFERANLPEFSIPDYSLTIQLSKPVEIDGKVDGVAENVIGKPGDICLLSAGTARQLKTSEPLELLTITVSQEAINRAVYEEFGVLNPRLINHRQLRDPLIEQIGKALKDEVESEYISGRLYGESLCLALSAHLTAKYSVVRPVSRRQKGGMSPQSLRRVVEYIRDNLSADLRLTELAKIAGLSQHRFCHNFKHTTGLAPHQYIMRERMEHAKQMLRETDLSVITIAYAVGCGSPSRFSVLFRGSTGVTPSAYRAAFK